MDAYRQSRVDDAQLAATLRRKAPNFRHHHNHVAWREPALVPIEIFVVLASYISSFRTIAYPMVN
jgi:hypothetical protein